jgi:Tol biopolymer transport system component
MTSLAIAAAGMAWIVAQLGAKGILAATAAVAFVTALVVVRRREDLVLGLSVLSVVALLHKSFGGLAAVSSGPPSIYISSFDVMVALLWLAWFLSAPDRMYEQLKAAFREWALWAPVAAFVLMLPSLLVAPNTTLAVAEVVRMFAAYSLYVYFAARINSRRQVSVVLGALATVACIEAVVVIGQRLTTSSLGLSLFGTPTILTNRDDGIAVARPFGTMAHPVFLAAFTGAFALIAYALAVTAATRRRSALWLCIAAAGTLPLLISNARSACLALAVAFVVLSAAMLVTHRLSGRTATIAIMIGSVASLPFAPYFMSVWHRSLENSHFGLEWQSRMQLNHVAVAMFEDRPFFGVGLNNFEQVLPHYDHYGLIFADNPVHNMYLLQLSETGVLGLLGLVLFVVPVVRAALRLAKSRDRMYSAIGFGVAGAFVFWGLEETLVFSLRQDHPRALLFMVSGLVVSCARITGREAEPARRPATFPRASSRTAAGSLNGVPGGSVTRRATRRAPRRSGRIARLWSAHAASHARPARQGARRAGRRRSRPPRPLPLFGRAQLGRGRHARDRQISRPQQAVLVTAMSALLLSVTAFKIDAAALDASLAGTSIVFSGIDRSTGVRNIYTVKPDGSDLRRVSPPDGRNYSWASWAFGGSKIVFSARSGPERSTEALYLMNPDGSGIRPLTANPWRNAQPHVTADGRNVIFTSFWDEFQKVAIYRMDLATGLVTNLSAVASQRGAFDSDPFPSSAAVPAGGAQQIFFVDGRTPDGTGNAPGEITVMNLDGAKRRALTHTGLQNTDPAPSPDGTKVAIARYIGPGSPRDPDATDPLQARLDNFVIIEHDVASGTEHQLTQGRACYRQSPSNECAPTEGSAYLPRYSSDGSAIAFVSILSSRRTCICLVSRDGASSRVIFSSTDLVINDFDWIRPSPPPPGAILDPLPSEKATSERLLVTSQLHTGERSVTVSTPDLWGGLRVDLPPRVVPADARWGPNGSIQGDGSRQYNPNALVYGPAPPGSSTRIRHYTLDLLQKLYRPYQPSDDLVGTRQVWSLDPSRRAMQWLTQPGTEDWRDAIPDGEARGNVEPSVSPDGRYVLFTNLSPVGEESFILRLDRQDGTVLSLTNATAGAMPVADGRPVWSPDGTKVAFASNDASGAQIWVMDADGYHARQLTDDGFLNVMPTWSRDGRYVAYSSYRGRNLIRLPASKLAAAADKREIDLTHWVLARVDVRTGSRQSLTRPQASPAFGAVYSKDGRTIYYIGFSGPPLQPDVWSVPADGGVGHPVQVTRLTHELSVDVR